MTSSFRERSICKRYGEPLDSSVSTSIVLGSYFPLSTLTSTEMRTFSPDLTSKVDVFAIVHPHVVCTLFIIIVRSLMFFAANSQCPSKTSRSRTCIRYDVVSHSKLPWMDFDGLALASPIVEQITILEHATRQKQAFNVSTLKGWFMRIQLVFRNEKTIFFLTGTYYVSSHKANSRLVYRDIPIPSVPKIKKH